MNTSQAFHPHPEGISPVYVKFITEACVMTSLSTVSVALRFVQRRSLGVSWDDWCILIALIFAYGFLITTILVATIAHAGYNVTGYMVGELETYMKIALANNVIYNASIFFSKTSILCFYHRIFSIDKSQRTWLRIVGALCLGHFLAAVFGLIFAFHPVHAQWTLTIPSTSIQQKPFWCSMGVINILLDVIILAIPQARVWRLHLSGRKRALISLVFLLGGFVIVASIIRIVYLLTVDVQNLTYSFAVPGIWTNVETNMSIICACLPIVYSLVALKTSKGSTGASYGKSGPAKSSHGYGGSAHGGFLSTQHRQQSDWESSQISMQDMPRHGNLRYVRIEADRTPGDKVALIDHEPMRPPEIRHEIEISSSRQETY